MARISPDGDYLSYLAPVEGVLNVWITAVEDPDSTRPITNDEERGIWFYWFTEDPGDATSGATIRIINGCLTAVTPC